MTLSTCTRVTFIYCSTTGVFIYLFGITCICICYVATLLEYMHIASNGDTAVSSLLLPSLWLRH